MPNLFDNLSRQRAIVEAEEKKLDAFYEKYDPVVRGVLAIFYEAVSGKPIQGMHITVGFKIGYGIKMVP